MIIRIWHGWTTFENAKAYEKLLRKEIFPLIKNKNVSGFKNIELLKKELSNGCEFITIMRFDNLTSVKEFAGEDYEEAFVLPEAKALLKAYDKKAQHYHLIINLATGDL